MIRAVVSNGAPVVQGPYSQALACGGFLFCSGQIPLSPETGALVTGTIEEAVNRCLLNLEAIVLAGGASVAGIVKVTVYLTDLRDAAAMNQAYERFFGVRALPTRTTVVVSALPKGAPVEIDCIAFIPPTHL